MKIGCNPNLPLTAPTRLRLASAVAPEPLHVAGSDLAVCLRRVEDHGEIMSLFEEPTNQQCAELLSGPTLSQELAEAQEEQTHMAVCEVCPDLLTVSPPSRVLSPQNPERTDPQWSALTFWSPGTDRVLTAGTF